MNQYAAVLRLDPVDVLRTDDVEDSLFPLVHDEFVADLFGALAKLSQKCRDRLVRASSAAVLLDARARMLERMEEALVGERLPEVVQRVHLERALEVLVISSHEDHVWTRFRFERFENRESVEFRHLDIEEHEIRRFLLDRPERFEPVRAFAQHLHVMGPIQQRSNAFAAETFVIDDERADRRRSRKILRSNVT